MARLFIFILLVTTIAYALTWLVTPHTRYGVLRDIGKALIALFVALFVVLILISI